MLAQRNTLCSTVLYLNLSRYQEDRRKFVPTGPGGPTLILKLQNIQAGSLQLAACWGEQAEGGTGSDEVCDRRKGRTGDPTSVRDFAGKGSMFGATCFDFDQLALENLAWRAVHQRQWRRKEKRCDPSLSPWLMMPSRLR